MDQPIVKIEGLSHRYSVQWAIRDIDIEIQGKGIYGLLGSNGAGKSTLMNIMCGVLKQTRGNVRIDGINTRLDPVEAKKRIGFLPQKPPLHTDLTVGEYLRYSAHLRRMADKDIPPAIDRALAKCGLTHFRKRLISNLSGGYQQRVGIAWAIIHEPALVVLDEPTNGLDPNQVLEVRNLIKEIAQERTVILSTHMLTEVQAMCDWIYMVEQGQIVFHGTVDEFDNYLTPNSLVIGMTNPPSVDELLSFEGVLEVEALTPRRFRVRYGDAAPVMRTLVGASVDRDWDLNEIGVEKNSLDSIFAELSKKKK